MTRDATGIPTILFGAFDRHNFGDLLFPHIAAALLQDKDLLFTGLAERDLRRCGGHRVSALAQLAAEWGKRPVNIIHAGGELLTCDAWEAAVMLLPPDEARDIIARFSCNDTHAEERLGWAHSQLGISGLAPYAVRRDLFPHTATMIYIAVGGVDLDKRDPAMRAEVLAKLEAADDVSVRDRQTQILLNRAGISVRLLPDCAVMTAELFGTKIRLRARENETARILKAFPQGYIAVQFGADFGDDETLAEAAAQLDRIALSSGYGVAFFRAGAAPWHDDLLCYQRVAAYMRTPSVTICTSLDLWDICALIAHSRAYTGSSLHGRIVAMAFALPRVNLLHPAQAQPSKQSAFAAVWEEPGMPVTIPVHEVAQAIGDALATDAQQRQRTAEELAALYREGFNAIRARLE